jgi:dTDP-4-amino-4,6-dideoxygalactose transaminase
MLTAFSRYGARVLPNTDQIVKACRARGELVQGPAIARFEAAFEQHCGAGTAVTASYGRMAFYYLLKALWLPPGSEIVFPALTFWVVPEMARIAGLTPVFADVDSETFCLDPAALERAITPRTSAVVPTHLYGLPCDMDRILAIAARHDLRVIEDCAHALGATYRGRAVGTFGDAAFFSFQTLKPLNTYGGGMALVRDPALARAVREQARAEPWPTERDVLKRFGVGKAMRIFIRPGVFTISLFPMLWIGSWFKARPDVYFWESIRSLDPLPLHYRQRYTNVQAEVGLAALKSLPQWTAASRSHAAQLDGALRGIPGVRLPSRPGTCQHAYYQYCFYAPDRDEFVRRVIHRGVDVETLHVDVCTQLPLFGAPQPSPGAERAAEAVQLPAYASLSSDQLAAITERIRTVLTDWAPAGHAAHPAGRSH